jgi:hypothetical protein
VGAKLIETAECLKSRLPKVKNFISLETSADGMLPHDELLENYSPTEPDIRVEEDNPFVIFYTRGTTGVPRGAWQPKPNPRRSQPILSVFPSIPKAWQGRPGLRPKQGAPFHRKNQDFNRAGQ